MSDDSFPKSSATCAWVAAASAAAPSVVYYSAPVCTMAAGVGATGASGTRAAGTAAARTVAGAAKAGGAYIWASGRTN